MRSLVSEGDLYAAAQRLKAKRQAEGKKTWLTVEYYNGWCHLHEVDADTEARNCCLGHVNSGTKREMLAHLNAAMY
jgi:hypothetical protein